MDGGDQMPAHFDHEDRRRQSRGDDEAEAQRAHLFLTSQPLAIGAAGIGFDRARLIAGL